MFINTNKNGELPQRNTGSLPGFGQKYMKFLFLVKTWKP